MINAREQRFPVIPMIYSRACDSFPVDFHDKRTPLPIKRTPRKKKGHGSSFVDAARENGAR
jgi:hypothetical protein